MSLEMPETPSSPDSLVEQLLERARVHAVLVHQVEQDPGSIAPQRVPIARPSSAVKPIVVATLRPPLHRAHAGAVAQVRDDRPPGRGAGIECRRAPTAMYS